jgi:hypothetical protein
MSFPIAARFTHPDYGYAADQALAAEHLEVGKVYLVISLEVGRSSSVLHLWDFPALEFNTVQFDAADWPDDDGEATP